MFVTPAIAQAVPPPAGEALQTETGVSHEAQTGVFPPFDPSTFPSQLLWLAITFGLFYLFLHKVVLPRIGGILEVRSDRIAQDLDHAARLKTESDAAIAAYEQELAEARQHARTIAQEARDEAKADAEGERKKAEAGLERRLAEAEARIAAIRDTALQDVGSIAEDTAGAIVQRLIGARAEKSAVAAAVKAVKE